MPVQLADHDDVARPEAEALLSLGGAVDHGCLERLLPHEQVEQVDPDPSTT